MVEVTAKYQQIMFSNDNNAQDRLRNLCNIKTIIRKKSFMLSFFYKQKTAGNIDPGSFCKIC